jgi:hypothetical protein
VLKGLEAIGHLSYPDQHPVADDWMHVPAAAVGFSLLCRVVMAAA